MSNDQQHEQTTGDGGTNDPDRWMDDADPLAALEGPGARYDLRSERADLGGRGIRGAGRGGVGWTGRPEGSGLATFLGLFSLGLGAVEVLAPRGLARFIGIRPTRATTAITQAMGLREIAAGVGILANPKSKEWVGARVGGDVVDLALLGAAFAKSERPGRTLFATVAVLAVSALDLLGTEQLAESRKSRVAGDAAPTAPSRVLRSITIGCPRAEAYGLWRDVTNLPRFMEGVRSVEPLGDGRSRWVARGPMGMSAEWESEITEDRPNELLAWRSAASSTLYHTGTVRFADAPRDGGTVVTVEMQYAPPGGKIAAALLKLFRKEPGQQIGDDLRRFKQVLELGEVVVSDATSLDHPRHAQPPPRETVH
jgi:uncharacterized membrane protein